MNAGRVFVVTGAAGGIGRSLVKRLLKDKAVVWALDLSSEALVSLVRDATRDGAELRTITADVSCEEGLRAAVSQIVKKDSRIDVWINNAGLSGLGDFSRTSADRFSKVMEVNFGGVVCGTRVALEHMELKGGGCIVNMGSVAGFVPAPYLSAYSASKHAVVGFTRALREELRLKQSGVRLVLVSPGFVDTGMLNSGEEGLKFPNWLKWAVSPPSAVTEAIVKALRSGEVEVVPTWNGRLMQGMHTLFPTTTRKSASLLLARNFRDWVLNRYTVS